VEAYPRSLRKQVAASISSKSTGAPADSLVWITDQAARDRLGALSVENVVDPSSTVVPMRPARSLSHPCAAHRP